MTFLLCPRLLCLFYGVKPIWRPLQQTVLGCLCQPCTCAAHCSHSAYCTISTPVFLKSFATTDASCLFCKPQCSEDTCHQLLDGRTTLRPGPGCCWTNADAPLPGDRMSPSSCEVLNARLCTCISSTLSEHNFGKVAHVWLSPAWLALQPAGVQDIMAETTLCKLHATRVRKRL